MKINKILLLLFSLLMVFGFFSMTVSADSENSKEDKNINYNEYDIAKELNELTDTELKERNISESEIKSIRNYKDTFEKHFVEMSKLTRSQLEKLDYTDEQIDILKNKASSLTDDSANYSEDDMKKLAATISLTLNVDNFNYNGSKTSARIRSDFNWNGVPAFKMKDILAVSWNNYVITGRLGGVTYQHIYGSEPSYFKHTTYTPPSLTSYGSGYSWNVAEQDNYFYADRGYVIFVVERLGRHHLEAYSAYGHQQGYATLSYSVLSGVDVQFSFQRKKIADKRWGPAYP